MTTTTIPRNEVRATNPQDAATTSRQIWLTTFKNAVGRLSKRFWKNPDGSAGVDGTTTLWKGSFEVFAVDAVDLPQALAAIGARIDRLGSDEAIVLGVPKDGALAGTITTSDRHKSGLDAGAIPRALSHFGAPPQGDFNLILFDGDGTDRLYEKLTELYPPFADVAVLTRPSASASVKNPKTGKPLKIAEHCYAAIDDPLLAAKCLDAFLRLAWINGQGWILLTEDGKMLPRGPVDASVGSLERLVYEGEVEIGQGIERLPRVSTVGGGAGILCAKNVLAYADRVAPQEKYLALVEAEKARDPARINESLKRKAAYREARIAEGVAQGKTREQAEADFDRVSANNYTKDGRIYEELAPSHILYIDGKPVTIAEIQANPTAYHGRVCADPKEPNYRSKNCAIIYTNGGRIIIPSFAHGSAYCYFAPLTEIDLLALLPMIEYEQRRKEAAKQLGVRIAVLDNMVGAARTRGQQQQVDSKIAEINADHALVLAGNKAAVMKFDSATRFRLLQVSAFKAWFVNQSVLVGKRAVPLGDHWMTHLERRQFSGIEFAPAGSAAQSGFYNLWQGFAVEPRAGDCSKFLAHLKDNAARGDEATYLWIVGWWAQIFQQPSTKMETALVLRGPFGAGKTKIGDVIGSLIGEHYLKVASERYITGQFNSHMSSLLVLHADEAFWAGDKASVGTLRDLVTGKDHMLEYKGVDPISIKNFIRLFVTGNPDWMVPAGFRERRWAIFDIGEEHMQDHAYFAAIDEGMNNGGREALLHHLLTFDLKQVNLRVVPKTAALLDQQIESMTPEQSWWFQTLMRGELPAQPDGVKTERVVLKDDLYARYIRHAQLQGVSHRSIETRVGNFLVDQLGTKLTNLRIMVDDRRIRCFRLPPLAECRALYAKQLGQTVDWEVSDGEVEEWQHDLDGYAVIASLGRKT